MAEAAVHAFFQVEMIEGFNEVGPIEVSVDTEHLAEDGLTDFDKIGGKATAFPNPITRTGKLRERRVQSSRSCWDRDVGTGGVETA